jgi:hypothetical protein
VLLPAGLLAGPATGLAQLGGLPLPTLTSTATTVTGQATVARVAVLGLLGTATTSALASTGVSAANAESDVGQSAGGIGPLLGAEVLNAATYSYSNEVDSTASLGNLALTVGVIRISADSVVAEASQVLGATGSGTSYISNLAINGVAVPVTGAANQAIAIPGGQLVLNEQSITSGGGAVVNAIHLTVNGVADVVVASATAAIS